jgi:energy-coupling factor transporter transmembrane protein EcfT
MSSRTTALVLTIFGAGFLFFLASEQAATAVGLVAGLIAIAAIWLASARARTVIAGISSVLWLAALVLAVFGSALAVIGCLIGLSGAVLTMLRGNRWPGFSARYARSADLDQDGLISPRQVWESLDKGLDPTRRKDTTSDDEPGSG